MIGDVCLALETGQDGLWISWGERWTVDQIRMQFARRHEGYLTRTCVHRLHVDANLVAHRSACLWSLLLLLLLLASAISFC